MCVSVGDDLSMKPDQVWAYMMQNFLQDQPLGLFECVHYTRTSMRWRGTKSRPGWIGGQIKRRGNQEHVLLCLPA